MRTDGQTDITMLIVAFHSFAKKPKNRYNAPIMILTNNLAVDLVQV